MIDNLTHSQFINSTLPSTGRQNPINADRSPSRFKALVEQTQQNGKSDTPNSPLEKAKAKAREFEAIFINSMVQTMFEGLESEAPFGGGHAEKVYRSMMVEQISNSISENGGFGIADQITSELLSVQERLNK